MRLVGLSHRILKCRTFLKVILLDYCPCACVCVGGKGWRWRWWCGELLPVERNKKRERGVKSCHRKILEFQTCFRKTEPMFKDSVFLNGF